MMEKRAKNASDDPAGHAPPVDGESICSGLRLFMDREQFSVKEYKMKMHVGFLCCFYLCCVASTGANPRTLFEALEEGAKEEVKQKAEVRENLTMRNDENLTPLMVAAKLGNIECVKTLVSAGADIDDNDRGFTVIDQLEGYLRRTGENKRRTVEMMKRNGYSKQFIESVEKDAASLNDNPVQINNWKAIIDYLNSVKATRRCGEIESGPTTNHVESLKH
jgi:hypothetical protein